MSFKLLVAACCLLAAVQARPPKVPTSCSIACVSRTFWTGYQVGKVYSYEFEQKVELTTDLSSSQKSRLQLTGLAKVEIHSDCELALTVEVKEALVGDLDADSMSPRETPSKVLNALRLPLRFSYENGQVVHLCPAESETRASLNIKRGLLSQLQVSIEQRGQGHQLEERDILGDCWTEYIPEGPNTLLKIKDLTKCKKLNYQVYPLTGVKSSSDESQQLITKGSVRCRIEIDPERDIVKETVCTQEQTQSADRGPQDTVEEKVRTSTRLSLKTETSGLVNALYEVSERSDLRHAHKTSSQCHSSSAWLEEDLFHSANECVERKHGAKTSPEFAAQAKKTLEELCEATKATDGVTRETPKKYADLIKYMRGITEQADFNKLYKWVREGYCAENPLLKAILRSAIPTVGTKQSVSLILDQLTNSNIEGAHRANWLINGIALMRDPTIDILPELLTYVKKRREDAMLDVTRDEPLALSAVVHKICQERPNCESEPKVKAVMDYFSESLGPACEMFTTDSDNAFVALLSVGNMGRVSGGAKVLVRCAANPGLNTVYRVFALHSLRRFSELEPEAKDQLIELMLNTELDSELRIVAYQALSRYSFDKTSRFYEAIRRLLNKDEDDRQVQMFVYTHAKSLKGDAASQIALVLRDASIVSELKKLSRHQYSNSLSVEYFSQNLGIGAQAEMPIIFSAQSALPRYVGLNLTVNMPTDGQSFNLMEIGVRMQGLERLVEEIYIRMEKKFKVGATELQGQSRPVKDDHKSELSGEQGSSYERFPASNEPRIDLLVRRYGAELSHTDLSGGFLMSIPEAISKTDYKMLRDWLVPKSTGGDEPIGLSAGTLAESTLSIPTIAGLPILVKKEMHYLTNLRVETKAMVTESIETSVDVKPAAAVMMSRTVALDAIFERAGIQSRTTYLTSTGLRLSLKKNIEGSADSQFSFKIEPLVKKQNVADAKTEVNFFQHTAGKVQIEKPVEPQQSIVKREKCIEGMSVKYTGHKLCYSSEYLPSCKKSLRSFRQCPGSYKLFAEKSDNLGAYEVSFSLKNQPKNRQLQIILGDQKSKDRLLKFNAQVITKNDNTNYKLELQNPIFPLVLDSNITKESSSYRVYTELQAGSVQYIGSGTVQSNSGKDMKLVGEFYPKEKLSQKLKVSLEHSYNGLCPILLPIATSKLNIEMHTGSQLNLEYDLKRDSSDFDWQMKSKYMTSKKEVTTVRYRIKLSNKDESSESSTIFLYDLEVQNPKENNLAHSLHTKVIRRTETVTRQTTASVSHKLQYGIEKKRSPIDFEARVSLRESTEGDNIKITGNGEMKYLKNGESVTVNLGKLEGSLTEIPDTTDGFSKKKRYLIQYFTKYEETSTEYSVDFNHLPWNYWTKTKQHFDLVVARRIGDGEVQKSEFKLMHRLNVEKYIGQQIFRVDDLRTNFRFELDHKMTKPEGTNSFGHELLLQTPKKTKVQAKWGVTWPEEDTMKSDIIIEVNGKKLLGFKQTLRRTASSSDHQVKHEMTLEMPPSSFNLETNGRISRQSAAALADFMNYQVRLITGRYNLEKSLRLLTTLLNDLSMEHSTKLVGPTQSQRTVFENTVDWASENVVWKNLLQVKIESKTILHHGVTITRIRRFSDSHLWTRKEGLKLEVKALDRSITSELEGGWFKDRKNYRSIIKLASKDTSDWHDMKLEINNKREENKWETLVKTEGKLNKRPITSSANITLGSIDAKDYIIITANKPGSKLRVKLNKTPSPMQLTANVNLDGDFDILSVKEMKASAELNMQDGVSLISEAETGGVQALYTKLKISRKVFIADLKTAHPMLQEVVIKSVIDTESAEETVKCETIIRYVGLKKRLQIKKTGAINLSYRSPAYSILFGATGKVEFEGLEALINYTSLQYDLMLKKKPGMEYQLITSITSPDSSAKQPLIYLTSVLNYWPFKAELQLKTKLPYVNYGVRAEMDYTNAFVGYHYKDSMATISYEIQDQSTNVKVAKFRAECNFCSLSRESLVAGQANMTWPLKLSEFELGMSAQIPSQVLQQIALGFVNRPNKKQIVATIVSNTQMHKLIDCRYTQTDAERGDALLLSDLRIFLGRMARAKVQASYQYGKDKEFKFGMTWANSDEEVLQGHMFWLSTPRNIDSITVTNIDRGLQLKGFGLDAYAVHTTKSDKNCEWHLSIKHPILKSPVTGRVEFTDRKIKSGMISAFDRELVLSSSQDDSVQVTLRTSSEEAKTLRVKWSGRYESQTDFSGKLELEIEGETNIVEVKAQPQKIVINYGKNTSPNVLKIEYEASDIESLRDMAAQLKITHETDAEKNLKLALLPGVQIPLLITLYPFKFNIKARSFMRSLAVNFEATNLGVKSMYYMHDFTTFPQSFSAEGNLIGSAGSQKMWEMSIKVDKDLPTVEALWQISDFFKVSLKAAKLEIKLKTKVDLNIQFPQLLLGQDDSDKQEMMIQVALPVLKIDEPIKLKISLQKTEGQRLTVEYGRGDDDKIIMWSVAVRKGRLSPEFEVDWETNLVSKVAKWGVRSISARLESSKSSIRDTEDYTATFKTSIKVNGDDLSTTTIRFDGKQNDVPKKVELKMTGHTECEFKLDLGKKDTLAKIDFSLNKRGESRDKYAMKLEVSSLKTNSWYPNFKLETECPYRQFVVGKEFKETAGESTVTIQLYLNKRMDHGASFTYKVESPTSDAPKYTVEIDLPTRKLRTVFQPEILSQKFGVMTTFDWDADKSTDKKVGLDARIDFSSGVLIGIECKAPFLTTKRVKIEGRYEGKDSGFGVLLKYTKGESEALVIKADYSYQQQAQTKVARFTLESMGAVESKISLNTQIAEEIEDFRRKRFDGTLKMKVHTYEKNIKFLYRPMREITITCDHGASLSLKYSTDQKNLYQVVLFVSNNDKQAARLKLALSKPLSQISAKLDVGIGSFNYNSNLRGPTFRPDTVLMRTNLTWEDEDVRVAAFFGKMTVDQEVISEDPASVPAHLNFIVFEVKKAEDNTRKFRINWRSPSRSKVYEIIYKVEGSIESIGIDAKTAVGSVFDYVKNIYLRASPTINFAWIAEELSSIASNDIDKLSLYFERAVSENEFYLRQILSGASEAGKVVKLWLSETAIRIKETLANGKIVDKIAEVSKRAWKSVVDFCESSLYKILEGILTLAREYTTGFSYIFYELIDKTVNTVKPYVIGMYELVSEIIDWISKYFDGLLALLNKAKEFWSRARSIVGDCAKGLKSLIVDDLLPLAVSHLNDYKVVRDFYENLLRELRFWYDLGATPEQRSALTLFPKSLTNTLNSIQNITEGWKLIYRGHLVGGIQKLLGGYTCTVLRPCDPACQIGETFASAEGFFYQPTYRQSWQTIKGLFVVLRRISSMLTREGLPVESIISATVGSTFGFLNPAERLLKVRHRTAVLTGDNHLITFDGLTLTHERPCKYLVAREFTSGLFSVIQEYRKSSNRLERYRLHVRFGGNTLIINPTEKDLELNGVRVSNDQVNLRSNKTIDAEGSTKGQLTIRFHGRIRNVLVIQWSAKFDSCVISVHPLYQGSVHGLAGSNDGRKTNDIRKNSASEHVKFWTVGQCVEEGSASVSFKSGDSSSNAGTNDCYAWFRKPSSPLTKCFAAVDPEPYLAICLQEERLGRDPCAATRQYTDRCDKENIDVQTPAKCTSCQLDSDGYISKPGMVRDKETLQKRMQVLFLVEDSACGLETIGTGGTRLKSVAQRIDNLKIVKSKLETTEFGLATFGGRGSPNSRLTKITSFGSVDELGDALTRLQLTGSNDETTDSTDVLQAVSDLHEKYQWRPLAQKHLIIISCKPCTAKSWNYANLFAKAQRTVQDRIFVHTITKRAIQPSSSFPDIMGYGVDLEKLYYLSDGRSGRFEGTIGTSALARTECSAELATESGSSAEGSVWRQEKFASNTEESGKTVELLVTKEIVRRLENPECRMCNCGSTTKSQPECRIVKCNN